MPLSASIAIAGIPSEPITVSLDQPLTIVTGQWGPRDFAQHCLAASLPRLLREHPRDVLVIDTSHCVFAGLNHAGLLSFPVINKWDIAQSILDSLPFWNRVKVGETSISRPCTVIINDYLDFAQDDFQEKAINRLRNIQSMSPRDNVNVIAIGSRCAGYGDRFFSKCEDNDLSCINVDNFHSCSSIPTKQWQAWDSMIESEGPGKPAWPPHRKKYARLLASIDHKARSMNSAASVLADGHSHILEKCINDLTWWLNDGLLCNASQEHLEDLADSHWWLTLAKICTGKNGPIDNYSEWYDSF